METQNNTQEIQTEQKTKAGHSIIGIAAVCLAAIVLAALLVPTIRWRVYPGDRVKGVVTVTIDGEPAAIVEDTLCSSYNKLENKTEFRVEGNALQVSTRANKYGGYDFAFDVEELPDMKFNS